MRKIIGAIAMATRLSDRARPACRRRRSRQAAGGRPHSPELAPSISPTAACAPGPHQVFDATITGKKSATLHIDGCVDLSNASNIRFTGSFTSRGHGDTASRGPPPARP